MLWGVVVLGEGGIEDGVMRQARKEVQYDQADGDEGAAGEEGLR